MDITNTLYWNFDIPLEMGGPKLNYVPWHQWLVCIMASKFIWMKPICLHHVESLYDSKNNIFHIWQVSFSPRVVRQEIRASDAHWSSGYLVNNQHRPWFAMFQEFHSTYPLLKLNGKSQRFLPLEHDSKWLRWYNVIWSNDAGVWEVSNSLYDGDGITIRCNVRVLALVLSQPAWVDSVPRNRLFICVRSSTSIFSHQHLRSTPYW